MPITPAKLIEAAPAVIDWDAVKPLKATGEEPVLLMVRGALCVEAATPFVLVMVTRAVRIPVTAGLAVT